MYVKEMEATNSTLAASEEGNNKKEWTTSSRVPKRLHLFAVAAVLEILGGWLVWQFVREKKSIWYLLLGFVILMAYGVVPTLQPLEDFGRTYAVYGGVFIVFSYAFARIVDGFKLDVGDYVGCAVSLVGVVIAVAWPTRGRRFELDSYVVVVVAVLVYHYFLSNTIPTLFISLASPS